MEILNFKTFHLIHRLQNTHQFKANINIPFFVDEINLRYITCKNFDDTFVSHIIKFKSNIVLDEIICVIPDSLVIMEQLNTPLKPSSPNIQGDYYFNFYDINDDFEEFGDFSICIVMIFIEYKKSKLLL